MAIPAMALLRQHDARLDILIELAACSDRSSGHSELGAQSGRKNQPACYFVSYLILLLPY